MSKWMARGLLAGASAVIVGVIVAFFKLILLALSGIVGFFLACLGLRYLWEKAR